jgi:hypothetical protein
MSNDEKIASLRRLSRDRGATQTERAAAKAKADELEFPGRGLSDAEHEAKIAIARREVKEADDKIREANSGKLKAQRLHTASSDALTRFTAESRLRQGLKLRELSDTALGDRLVNGNDETKRMVNNEIERRRLQRISERMREVTLHQLCVVFFERVKGKQRDRFGSIYTHQQEERSAAENEIMRRIKKPEVGALSDDREDEEDVTE